MNLTSSHSAAPEVANDKQADNRPILIVPYMWIGDFVRCHSVIQLLLARFPERPVDMLASTLCKPLTDYMPDLRQAIVWDMPRNSLALGQHVGLAKRLKQEGYGTALIMPRTWKSALAPYLAGTPERTGFFGEARYLLLTDLRSGERALPRMVDRCAALALPPGAPLPPAWPEPKLKVTPAEAAAWRQKRGLDRDGRRVVALAPGAVGPSKRWPSAAYAALTRRLLADGLAVWVLGGPDKKLAANKVGDTADPGLLSGTQRRDTIVAPSSAAAVSNDSGL